MAVLHMLMSHFTGTIIFTFSMHIHSRIKLSVDLLSLQGLDAYLINNLPTAFHINTGTHTYRLFHEEL